MLIVMKMDAAPEHVDGVVRKIEAHGLKAHPIAGAQRTAIGITGNIGVVDRALFASLPGVLDVIRVSHPYKLVSREFKPQDTVVKIGGVPIGGPDFIVIGGPCSVESYEQTLRIAQRVKAAGAHLLRGGAYKPRTSPYSFQGLGEEGNPNVVLCERGIRTFADHSRNTLDLTAVPVVKRISHLPIITDPSHASGDRDRVLPLARASVAVGADGVMVEVHDQPDAALSDGDQALLPEEFERLVAAMRQLAPAVERSVPTYAAR